MAVSAKRKYVTRGRARRRKTVLLFIILCIVTLTFFFPIGWMIITSLKFHKDIFAAPPKILFTPTLSNYIYVLENSHYLKYLANSLVASLISAVVATFVGALAAYAFSRFKIRGTNQFLLWVLSLRMTPPMAVAVPFYLMAVQFHLYDTQLGLALVLTTVALPIAVWMQISYVDTVPVAIDEAAMVDGCSRFGAFARVVLPLEAAGLVATLILCFIFSWNEFPLSSILTTQHATTLPVSMMGWDTERGLEWGKMMAAGTIAAAPVMVFAIIIQRYLVRGLTLGAVIE